MLVVAATEMVTDALENEQLDSRDVKNAVDQYRWQASKLDRETFGERRTVEVQQKPVQELSDQALEMRIKALVGDKDVKNYLSDKGITVMEAEIVKSSAPPETKET